MPPPLPAAASARAQDDEITVMGDVEPDPDEPEQRNSGLPPLPSVKSAFLEQGWSSRPPAPGPSAAVVAAAVPKAAPLPTPPPAFPPPNKTLAGLPLPPAVKWTPEVHNEHPSVKAPAAAAQPYRGEPRLPTAAAAPVAPAMPTAVAVAHGAAVPPPTAPASLEAALFPGSRPPPVPSMQPMASVQSPLSQAAAAQAQVAFSQTAPMAAVQPAVFQPPAVPSMGTASGMGTAPMPAVSATVPTAPSPLVGPSVDIDEFARSSKRGAGGVMTALFASKPRVAAVFFLLGVVVTWGLQGLFGSDSSDATQADGAAASRAVVADKQASAKAAESPGAAKAEPKEEKVADKVEPPAAAASASAEPAEPAADEEPSSAAKSTKSSASAKFNKTAANKAMSNAAARAGRCKSSGKGGPAKVSVTFAPSGKVSLVQIISGRFDSKTLACIRSAFQAARVPAFTGKPEAVVKSFTVK